MRNPDEIVRISELPIISGESLRAVRFDGARGYAVTFFQVDPLFVMDLSEPADPQLAGNLEVPGYSTHLVPLGTRLVGVGLDDTDGVRPAVALCDVSNRASPVELSRIIVGEAGRFETVSEATVDEKALKVIEDAGLILLPFSSVDAARGGYVDSLQLIELARRRSASAGGSSNPASCAARECATPPCGCCPTWRSRPSAGRTWIRRCRSESSRSRASRSCSTPA